MDRIIGQKYVFKFSLIFQKTDIVQIVINQINGLKPG